MTRQKQAIPKNPVRRPQPAAAIGQESSGTAIAPRRKKTGKKKGGFPENTFAPL
jgi:hypothetical protein